MRIYESRIAKESHKESIVFMEAPTLPTPGSEGWAEKFSLVLQTQRDRVRAFLDAQEERLQRAETEIALQIRLAGEQVTKERSAVEVDRNELQFRAEQLQRQSEHLEKLRADIETRQADWEQIYQRCLEQQQAWTEHIQRQQAEMDQRRRAILEQEAAIEETQTRLESEKKALQAKLDELGVVQKSAHDEADSLTKRLEAANAELTAKLETAHQEEEALVAELRAQQEQTERQAAEFAEFRQKHEEVLGELENWAEPQPGISEEEFSKTATERDQFASRLAEIEAELVESQKLVEELSESREKLASMQKDLENRPAQTPGVPEEEYRELTIERDKLIMRLTEMETQLADTQRQLSEAATQTTSEQAEGGDSPEDYHRLYQMAMDDLHELKEKNAELQNKLSAQGSSAGGGGHVPTKGGVLDWEAEKKRILAALESDFDEDEPERIKIAEVIQKTDSALAEKDREIGELRELLEKQSDNLGAVAVGAAALGQIFDTDAIILEERENLKRQQEEWREKLRKAEVEVSIERAKLARERLQLEDRIRQMERQGATDNTANPPDGGAKSGGGSSKGRWLDKLGLRDHGEKK